MKSKLRYLLREVLPKVSEVTSRDKIKNRQLVKGIITDQPGCYIKILANNLANANDIKSILTQNKDQFGLEEIQVNEEIFEAHNNSSNLGKDGILNYNNSVTLKVNPELTFLNILSESSYDYRNLRERVLELNQKKKIVIDFSSPNIAKPFHFGHLKSTILGNYLANLNKFLGNDVTRLNYIGDWGTQYGLLNLGLDQEFNEKEILTAESPLRKLLDIYVKANERGREDESFFVEAKRRFLQMSKDTNSIEYKRWNMIRELSMDELKKSYDQLGINFDVFDYESDYARSSLQIVDEMIAKKLAFKLEDGVVKAKIPKRDKIFEVNIKKSDGTSLYITRDISAAVSRMERYNFDNMLYVVGADQEKHFYSLKEILHQLNYDWSDKLDHVKTGKVLGLSSRKGNVALLSDIIEEATSQCLNVTRMTPTSKVAGSEKESLKVSKQLAISALFVFDMRHPRMKNYHFEWSYVMQRDNKSGINLQTTYARLCSLLDKSSDAGFAPIPFEDCYDKKHLLDIDSINYKEAQDLITVMGEFEDAIYISHSSMEPNHLVNHGLRLCKAINRARKSENLWILGESNEMKAKTRLSLFRSAHLQLEIIIKLIGLRPLSKV